MEEASLNYFPEKIKAIANCPPSSTFVSEHLFFNYIATTHLYAPSLLFPEEGTIP
jgi:hypothetical protein